MRAGRRGKGKVDFGQAGRSGRYAPRLGRSYLVVGGRSAAACAHLSRPRRGGRRAARALHARPRPQRSEEHTSELQSLMRISYAVFCLKKKKTNKKKTTQI